MERMKIHEGPSLAAAYVVSPAKPDLQARPLVPAAFMALDVLHGKNQAAMIEVIQYASSGERCLASAAHHALPRPTFPGQAASNDHAL